MPEPSPTPPQHGLPLTAPRTPASESRWQDAVLRWLQSGHLVLGLAVAYFLALLPFAPGLASPGNLLDLLRTLLPLFIVATGQMVVLITGGIDLSVCSIMALSSVAGALTMNGDSGWLAGNALAMPVGVLVMLCTGAAVGLINGLAVTQCRMPPFMVTLATMMFVSGFAIWITQSGTIYNLPAAFNALGGRVGQSLILAGALGLALHLLLRRTVGGRWLYALGSNARTARISGVPVDAVTTAAYVISGVCAAVAAILYTGQAETGSPVLGQRLLLDIIAGTVIGGASLFGGRGTVVGTLCGVLFIKLVDNSLNLLDLSLFAIMMVKGGVILLASLLDALRLKPPLHEPAFPVGRDSVEPRPPKALLGSTESRPTGFRAIAHGLRAKAASLEARRRTRDAEFAPAGTAPERSVDGAPAHSTAPRPLLEFHGVSRSFSRVRVLRAVSFPVGAGRTLGLVGENGAGKSTLMNILGGNLRPDSGHMWLDRREYRPTGPADAVRLGIGFVHQELNLCSNLTIAENLHLTRLPRWRGLPLLDRTTLRQRTAALLERVGLDLAPDLPLARLGPGERQLVEIAKALSLETRLLILDEPTTSLSTRETQRLFALLETLRSRGLAMIYISHQLEHVLRLCDDLVVLRDGAVVGQGPRSAFDADRLIALMVGRNLGQLFPTRRSRACVAPRQETSTPGEARLRTATPVPDGASALPSVDSPAGWSCAPVLEVRDLTQPGLVRNVTFTLHRGEVLGLSGLMGAGRSELARLLFGLEFPARGVIRLQGHVLARSSIRQRIRRGLAFLTEDRRAEGLCLDASIAENIALVALPQHAAPPLGLLQLARLSAAVDRIRDAVRLTAAARNTAPVKTLSGGNQQKVVLAKWLLARPPALMLDEPTRGIDVGARYEIYQLVLELADQGTGVLLISSEWEELIGLCDRILVMRRGEIVDDVPRSAFDPERLLRGALGA